MGNIIVPFRNLTLFHLRIYLQGFLPINNFLFFHFNQFLPIIASPMNLTPNKAPISISLRAFLNKLEFLVRMLLEEIESYFDEQGLFSPLEFFEFASEAPSLPSFLIFFNFSFNLLNLSSLKLSQLDAEERIAAFILLYFFFSGQTPFPFLLRFFFKRELLPNSKRN